MPSTVDFWFGTGRLELRSAKPGTHDNRLYLDMAAWTSLVTDTSLKPWFDRTPLWTLCQHHSRLMAEIVRQDNHWELRLFAQGALFLRQRCATRDAAVASADLIHRDCERDGWFPSERQDS